jgi:hypothetical protein
MKLITYLFLFGILVFTACEEDQSGPQIQGSGNVISEIRDLDSFQSIHISSIINATIIQGNQDVLVNADDNIIELIKTEVRDNVLYIDLEDGEYGEIYIQVNIATPQLNEITTTGVNNIEVNQLKQQGQLTLNIEGVGNFSMSGSADQLLINSIGASNLEAFDFEATNCEINLSGVQITVSEILSGALSGVGNILYKGAPSIDVSVTGVGNVVNAN